MIFALDCARDVIIAFVFGCTRDVIIDFELCFQIFDLFFIK
jgi:hypothetical protein